MAVVRRFDYCCRALLAVGGGITPRCTHSRTSGGVSFKIVLSKLSDTLRDRTRPTIMSVEMSNISAYSNTLPPSTFGARGGHTTGFAGLVMMFRSAMDLNIMPP